MSAKHQYTFTVLPALSALCHTQNPLLQPQNPWLSHFLTLWPSHLEQSPPRHQALCYSLFLEKPTQDISLLRIFQLSHIVLQSCQSVQCVCMRACVCVCTFCIIMLKLLPIYLFCFCFFITFSISMYIMCVCMFSALSRKVGALQISIIIITCSCYAAAEQSKMK